MVPLVRSFTSPSPSPFELRLDITSHTSPLCKFGVLLQMGHLLTVIVQLSVDSGYVLVGYSGCQWCTMHHDHAYCHLAVIRKHPESHPHKSRYHHTRNDQVSLFRQLSKTI